MVPLGSDWSVRFLLNDDLADSRIHAARDVPPHVYFPDSLAIAFRSRHRTADNADLLPSREHHRQSQSLAGFPRSRQQLKLTEQHLASFGDQLFLIRIFPDQRLEGFGRFLSSCPSCSGSDRVDTEPAPPALPSSERQAAPADNA